jgi:4-diphosphocytidyl-2-C-methyl-D-erythritol kinase
MITISAPAKINLTLEVLGQRADGYHEVRSVIQTISLCDSLSFEPADGLEFKSDSADWVAEKSLVSKAAMLLQPTGRHSRGAIVGVKKLIPLLAGLGGDSSDAAATLRGLNQLWGLGLTREQLVPLARQLGSDVAFFLYGGTALVEGRGEIVTPLPPLLHRWVVVAVPPLPRQPGKTRQLYESLRPGHYTDGRITQKLMAEIRAGREFSTSLLFNTFENVALAHFSGLDVSRRHMVKMGATNVLLAGSGPALFTLLEDKAQAEALCSRLKEPGREPYLTETLPALGQSQVN